jgi:hypothetical protein
LFHEERVSNNKKKTYHKPLKQGVLPMFEVNEKEALFRVRRYDLRREDGRLAIEVREKIAGESSFDFYAIPSLQGNACDQREYWGIGQTENEALQDCLNRIKDISIQALFPPPAS